jgi:hypothetical protein
MQDKNAAVSLRIGRHLLATVVFATVIVFAGFAGPRQALAQNLVQDPNFFNGLADYQTTGEVVSLNVSFGPTPPNGGDGTNTAVLYGPGVEGPNGVGDGPATVSQAIATVPNTVYLVTFSVNFDPDTTDALIASFGNGTFPLNPTVEPSGLATYSFTGRATGTSTELAFATDDGADLITELEVEAGPAPVTGGGVLSFGAILAGLAIRRMRRRGVAGEVRVWRIA